MGRKPANPVEIWRAYAGLGMLAFEAQAVVGMRLLGMSGAWPVGKGENRKMLSEKPPAFSKAANAAARKAASGGRPDQVLLAAVKPLTMPTTPCAMPSAPGSGSATLNVNSYAAACSVRPRERITLATRSAGRYRSLHRGREGHRASPTYGEEVKFGGGKVIRDGMGQSQVTRAEARSTPSSPMR
jgi:hypothetical protein